MPPWLLVAENLGAAWLAGSVIGVERSINGRAAGFRTHALVALAAGGAAILTLEPMFFPGLASGLRLDPSRLSQGVMAGVGFLGAGVIFKEGLSVQGLTTAASVWACAATGFLFGCGMYEAGCLLLVAMLVTLSLFRVVEERAPWPVHSYTVLRFRVEAAPDEASLKRILTEQRTSARNIGYKLNQGGQVFEYTADLETPHRKALSELVVRLREMPGLVEFELSRVSK